LSSDAIWKYSPYEVDKESSGLIFTIFASKNKAVRCEVQTHFSSSPLARFTKKVQGAFSRFMHSNAKLFGVKFRRILEVFTLLGL